MDLPNVSWSLYPRIKKHFVVESWLTFSRTSGSDIFENHLFIFVSKLLDLQYRIIDMKRIAPSFVFDKEAVHC